MGVDYSGTAESCYSTQNEQESTQNNLIEGGIIREMTVDTDQKYQEKVEAAVNMICQLKQRYQLNKGHYNIAVPAVEEV